MSDEISERNTKAPQDEKFSEFFAYKTYCCQMVNEKQFWLVKESVSAVIRVLHREEEDKVLQWHPIQGRKLESKKNV